MEFKWYITRVLSGCEEKVASIIMQNAQKFGMEDDFSEIFIPYEVKRQKKETVKKKLCPGYLFLFMRMNDASMNLVKKVPNVSCFLADNKGFPKVIPRYEIELMKDSISQEMENDKNEMEFNVGDLVRIIDGPFNYFTGEIAHIDEKKNIAKVLVKIFSHTTKIELELNHLEKVES